MFNYIVQLYRDDMMPIAIHGCFEYNEAIFWGKNQKDRKDVKCHGYIVFDKNKNVEYFEEFT